MGTEEPVVGNTPNEPHGLLSKVLIVAIIVNIVGLLAFASYTVYVSSHRNKNKTHALKTV